MRKLFVFLCILSVFGMVGWKLSESWREKRSQKQRLISTSDAANIKETITIAGDDWLGYLVFRSRAFQTELEKRQIGVRFVMEPDFKARFAKLSTGEYDIACGTIDSYLLNGESSQYPGVIIFGIDESHGGDALVVKKEIQSLDDLKKPGIQGAFVGFSPSEFLLKSQISHFGIEALLPRVSSNRTDEASAAYQQFSSGSADFAVLWEPFASRAVAEVAGARRLIDTRQARGLIIDVAIASRDLVAGRPEVVQALTDAYFLTLQQFLQNPDDFREQAKIDTGESDSIETMLSGIRFLTAKDNEAAILGSGADSTFSMTGAISSIARVLIDVKDLPNDPLQGNPRLILNSRFLEQSLSLPGLSTQAASLSTADAQPFFRPMAAEAWQSLAENLTGTLVEEPITFGVGQSEIPEEFQSILHDACAKLIHYPGHRVIVQAHVSPGSDPAIDLSLSQERAAAIRSFLVEKCKVSPERVFAQGKGGEQPVAKKQGESSRAWKRRCRRARIFIAEDT